MKSANYDKLMKKITVSNEVEQYNVINRRIDEILSAAYNKDEAIRSLICIFEARCNQSIYYAVVSIFFAITMGIFSLFPEDLLGEVGIFTIITGLIIVAILILIVCKCVAPEEERKNFILHVLKMRYNDIQHNEISQKENSKSYIVTVKTN